MVASCAGSIAPVYGCEDDSHWSLDQAVGGETHEASRPQANGSKELPMLNFVPVHGCGIKQVCPNLSFTSQSNLATHSHSEGLSLAYGVALAMRVCGMR